MDSYYSTVYDYIDNFDINETIYDAKLETVIENVIAKLIESFKHESTSFDIKFENMVINEHGTDVRLIDFSDEFCVNVKGLTNENKEILKNILILSIYIRLLGMGPTDLKNVKSFFEHYINWFMDIDTQKLKTGIKTIGSNKYKLEHVLINYFPKDYIIEGINDIIELYNKMLEKPGNSFGAVSVSNKVVRNKKEDIRNKKEGVQKGISLEEFLYNIKNRDTDESRKMRKKLLHMSNENYEFNKQRRELEQKEQKEQNKNKFGRKKSRRRNSRSIKKK